MTRSDYLRSEAEATDVPGLAEALRKRARAEDQKERWCYKHVGGPGLRVNVGKGCVHLGPLMLALTFSVLTGIATIENASIPWWGVIPAVLFWPLLSIAGQLFV